MRWTYCNAHAADAQRLSTSKTTSAHTIRLPTSSRHLPSLVTAGGRQHLSRHVYLVRSQSEAAHVQPAATRNHVLRVLRALSHTQAIFSPYARSGVALRVPYTWDQVCSALDHAQPLLQHLTLAQLATLADVLAAAGYHNPALFHALADAAAQQLAALHSVYIQPQPRAAYPYRLTWHARWVLKQRAKRQRLRRAPSRDMLAPIQLQIARKARFLPREPAQDAAQMSPPAGEAARLTPSLVWMSLTRLAVACARLGLVHKHLLQLVALTGAQLLQAAPPSWKQRHSVPTLARMLVAFASLGLYPQPLACAVVRLVKFEPVVLDRMPGWETVLLLWALARMRHPDQTVLLLLQARASDQVGMFNCQQLSRTYALLGAVEVEAHTNGRQGAVDWSLPEGQALLAALRRSTRLRLNSFSAPQLVPLLLGLAALQQRDSLLLDELSRWLHNKSGNFTARDLCSIFSSCAALGYRNTWLLGQLSRVLVSRRLCRVQQMPPQQLLQLLSSCSQLGYSNPRLLDHVGEVVLAPAEVAESGLEALQESWRRELDALQQQQQQRGRKTQPSRRLQQLLAAVQEQQQRQVVSLPPLVSWRGSHVCGLLQQYLLLRVAHPGLFEAAAQLATAHLESLRVADSSKPAAAGGAVPPSVAQEPEGWHLTTQDKEQQAGAGVDAQHAGSTPASLSAVHTGKGHGSTWTPADGVQVALVLQQFGALNLELLAAAVQVTQQQHQHTDQQQMQQQGTPEVEEHAPLPAEDLQRAVQLAVAAVAAVLEQQQQQQQAEGVAGGSDVSKLHELAVQMLRLVQRPLLQLRAVTDDNAPTAANDMAPFDARQPAAAQVYTDVLGLLQATYALQQLQLLPQLSSSAPTGDAADSSDDADADALAEGGAASSSSAASVTSGAAGDAWGLGVPKDLVDSCPAPLAAAAGETHGKELAEVAAALQALPGATGWAAEVSYRPAGSSLLVPIALLPPAPTSVQPAGSGATAAGVDDASSTSRGSINHQPIAVLLVAAGGYTRSRPKEPMGAVRLQQLFLRCSGWQVVLVPLDAWQQTQQLPPGGRQFRRQQLLADGFKEASLWDVGRGQLAPALL